MADQQAVDHAVVPDDTNWSDWTHSLALRAVTGDDLDVRALSRAQWIVFDPSSVDRPGGNDEVGYQAYNIQYYGATINHRAVADYEAGVEEGNGIAGDLGAGVRGPMDVSTLARLRDKVAQLEGFLADARDQLRRWTRDLESTDAVSGSAAHVIQIRLDRYAAQLGLWSDRLRVNPALPLSTAVENARADLDNFRIGMVNTWQAAESAGLRGRIQAAIDAEIAAIRDYLVSAGIVAGTPEYTFDKSDPTRQPNLVVTPTMIQDFHNGTRARILAVLSAYPKGDLRQAATWARINQSITGSVSGLLDNLDATARQDIKPLHASYLTLASGLRPLGTTAPPPGTNAAPESSGGQNSAGQNSAGQNSAGQNSAGQNSAGQNSGGPPPSGTAPPPPVRAGGPPPAGAPPGNPAQGRPSQDGPLAGGPADAGSAVAILPPGAPLPGAPLPGGPAPGGPGSGQVEGTVPAGRPPANEKVASTDAAPVTDAGRGGPFPDGSAPGVVPAPGAGFVANATAPDRNASAPGGDGQLPPGGDPTSAAPLAIGPPDPGNLQDAASFPPADGAVPMPPAAATAAPGADAAGGAAFAPFPLGAGAARKRDQKRDERQRTAFVAEPIVATPADGRFAAPPGGALGAPAVGSSQAGALGAPADGAGHAAARHAAPSGGLVHASAADLVGNRAPGTPVGLPHRLTAGGLELPAGSRVAEFGLPGWDGRVGGDGVAGLTQAPPVLPDPAPQVGYRGGLWPGGQYGPLPTQLAGSPVPRSGAALAPYLPAMGATRRRGSGERGSRETWLTEDEEVWGFAATGPGGVVGLLAESPDDEDLTGPGEAGRRGRRDDEHEQTAQVVIGRGDEDEPEYESEYQYSRE